MYQVDQVLVGPTHDELFRALHAATNLLGGFFRHGIPQRGVPAPAIGDRMLTTAEGWHQWDFPTLGQTPISTDFLGVAWWTDHIGRRHYRLASQRRGFVDRPPPNFLCPYGQPRPPLWLVYPGHTFLRQKGGQRDLLAMCRCGVIGTTAELAWMGDCCGPCHDRRESGIAPPRLWEKTTFSLLEEGISIHLFSTLSPDGRFLAAGAGYRPLHVWDVETGREFVTPAERESGNWTGAAFAPDGRTLTLARSGGDPGLHQFDVPTWQRRSTLSVLEWGNRLVYSPDGSLLGGLDTGLLRLLETATGRTRLVYHSGRLTGTSCLAFSPDSRTVAGSSTDGTVRVAHAGTGQENITLRLPRHLITSLAFSTDGSTLAAGTIRTEDDGFPLEDRGRVYLWDLSQPPGHRTLPGHALGTLAVAYSPDGSVLATGGCDRLVRLWDVHNGSERCALELHFADVRQLCFSADGRWLSSMSEDGAIRLWPWRQLLEC